MNYPDSHNTARKIVYNNRKKKLTSKQESISLEGYGDEGAGMKVEENLSSDEKKVRKDIISAQWRDYKIINHI